MRPLQKHLSNKKLTVETINEALVEIKKESARGAAALASAMLEHLLGACLQRLMVNLTKTEIDQLFVGMAPLSTFSSRVKLAYALGIFGKKTRHDIEIVREIRNAVVHTQHIVNFDEPAVDNLVSSMNCIRHLGSEAPNSTQCKFAMSVEILLRHLVSNMEALFDEKYQRGYYGLD